MDSVAIDKQLSTTHISALDGQLPTDSREKEDGESADDSAFAVYMNDSQIKAAKAAANRPTIASVPKLTPDVDPRNILYPAGKYFSKPISYFSQILKLFDCQQFVVFSDILII